MRKTLFWTIWVFLLVAIASLLLVLYWLLWPYKVFEFYTPKNKIVTPQVKRGEAVRWEVDVNHLTDGVRVEVARQLQDGVLVSFPPTSYVTKRGRQTFINASTIIPSYATPGKYKVVIYNYVHINPVRTLTIVRETEDFEVIK